MDQQERRLKLCAARHNQTLASRVSGKPEAAGHPPQIFSDENSEFNVQHWSLAAVFRWGEMAIAQFSILNRGKSAECALG
jgi:hypothetical protein